MQTNDSRTTRPATSRPGPGRRAALLAVLAGLLTLGAAAGAGAAQGGQAPAASAPAASQAKGLEPFEAGGLPAGRAIGVPVRRAFPPGFSLKHAHGGPTYVYVLSGTLNITDATGNTVTYGAGDFFWEPAGYIHTAQTAEGAEVFILFLLPPSAEAIIPVP
jgi:hypothetical protein